MKNTVITFGDSKVKNRKLTVLTAYDYSMARLIDEAGVDGILVGDSLGNVMLGYDSTLPVTMEDMIHHGKAVTRGVKKALVVVDMPFMSYHASVYDAVTNAGRIIKETNADAVKLEGGKALCPQIKAITEASIPVMAHLGLTPQSIRALGGFKVQGKSVQTAKRLIEDAKAVEDAGAFALVLECIPSQLAKMITEMLTIPTIGIGAGNFCDGQVLVCNDMLGMFSDFAPKFVKKYANVGDIMRKAFSDYINETQNGDFPSEEYSYTMDSEVIDRLYG